LPLLSDREAVKGDAIGIIEIGAKFLPLFDFSDGSSRIPRPPQCTRTSFWRMCPGGRCSGEGGLSV
jgi:hypothetical protein